MANIKFLKGLVANLPAQSTDGAVYFTQDGHIYLGIADGKYQEYTDFHKVANVAALPATQSEGLYYATEENVLCVWGKKSDGSDGWVQINPDHNTTYTLEEGTQNGTVKLVGSDGSSVEIAVHGLGTAAFTDTDAYAPAEHTHTMENVTGLADAIADAKKAGTDAQDAVSTLDEKVGDIPDGATSTTVIDYVDEKINDIVIPAAPEYTITKADTAETGFIATYHLTKNGENVGAAINVPKDFLVKSATVATATAANTPYTGAKKGDKYIDWVINTKDGSEADEHLYLPVNELVDPYTSGSAEGDVVQIIVSADNKISASIDLSAYYTSTQVDSKIQEAIGALGTMAHENKDDYVAVENGKRLMTDTEGTKLEGIAEGAQVNVVESIKINGVAVTPDDAKAVDITIPSGELADKDEVAEDDLNAELTEKVNAGADVAEWGTF